MNTKKSALTPPAEDELAARLRELHYQEPSPELRRKTLAAARQVFYRRGPSFALGDWWRELALAAAVVLLCAGSWLSISSGASAEHPNPPSLAAGEDLAITLGLEDDFADFVERRFLLQQGRGAKKAPVPPRYDDPT